MSKKMLTRFLVAVAPLVLVLGACADSDDTSSSDTSTSTVSDTPRLTFDGSTCVYEGPVEVTAGVVAVEFVNDSDGRANIGVVLIDEGKTVQDFVDALGPEPSQGTRGQTWLYDMGGRAPAGAGATLRWESSLAAGLYATNCTQTGKDRSRNEWFGSGFTVINS